MRDGRAGLLEQLPDESMKEKNGSARCACRDFHVLPCDAAAPTGLQRLEGGFFCREACGIMLRGDRTVAMAVSAFIRGIDALDKARRARDDFTNAADFDNVYPDGNNH